MFEAILIMVSLIYSAFFSLTWLWLSPIALVIFCVKEYLREEEKKNKKRG